MKSNHFLCRIGLHLDSFAVGVAPRGREEAHFIGAVASQSHALSRALGRLGKPHALRIVYEAGSYRYTSVRHLRASGYACKVIASANTAGQSSNRIKAARRDAPLLALA